METFQAVCRLAGWLAGWQAAALHCTPMWHLRPLEGSTPVAEQAAVRRSLMHQHQRGAVRLQLQGKGNCGGMGGGRSGCPAVGLHVCVRVCGLPLWFLDWLRGGWLLAAPMSAAGWCWVIEHRGQHAQHARHECVQQECRLGAAGRRSGSGSAVAVAVAWLLRAAEEVVWPGE